MNLKSYIAIYIVVSAVLAHFGAGGPENSYAFTEVPWKRVSINATIIAAFS